MGYMQTDDQQAFTPIDTALQFQGNETKNPFQTYAPRQDLEPILGHESFSASMKAAFELNRMDSGLEMVKKLIPEDLPTEEDQQILSPREANDQYPGLQVPITSPITRGELKIIQEGTDTKRVLSDIIERSSSGILPGAARLGAGLFAHAIDPVEIGATAMLGWGIGAAAEGGFMGERLGRLFQMSKAANEAHASYGEIKSLLQEAANGNGVEPLISKATKDLLQQGPGLRLKTGAIEGGIASAAFQPAMYGMAKADHEQYGLKDSFMSMAGVMLGMSFLHYIGESAFIRYDLPEGVLGSKEDVKLISPETHDTMMTANVGRMYAGKAPEIMPFIEHMHSNIYNKLPPDETFGGIRPLTQNETPITAESDLSKFEFFGASKTSNKNMKPGNIKEGQIIPIEANRVGNAVVLTDNFDVAHGHNVAMADKGGKVVRYSIEEGTKSLDMGSPLPTSLVPKVEAILEKHDPELKQYAKGNIDLLLGKIANAVEQNGEKAKIYPELYDALSQKGYKVLLKQGGELFGIPGDPHNIAVVLDQSVLKETGRVSPNRNYEVQPDPARVEQLKADYQSAKTDFFHDEPSYQRGVAAAEAGSKIKVEETPKTESGMPDFASAEKDALAKLDSNVESQNEKDNVVAKNNELKVKNRSIKSILDSFVKCRLGG